MFRSIAHESSLTQRAQVQIEDLIVGGALTRGDRLPSERELTERLQVSKTVVREAICALVGKGLLEVRAGSGVYVRHFGSDVIEEPMKLLLRANVLKPARTSRSPRSEEHTSELQSRPHLVCRL